VIGDVFPFDGTASYTLEVWAQPLAANGDPMCMVSKNIPDDAGALRDGYSFFLENDTGRVTQNRYRNGVEENASGPAIAPGAFRHLVATFDGAVIRLYVDGEKVAEQPSSRALQTVTNPLTLGASRGGIYCFFRGALDEIAIYGKALAPERIRAHHTVGVGQ
jgi:Concanavalin A-like lectin/glucanases superfamily